MPHSPISPTSRTTFAAAGLLAALAAPPRAVAAQALPVRKEAPAAARSTATGVYTAEQAARGQDVYALNCQSCHTPASHSAPTFRGTWAGRTLWELFDYIRQQMPKQDPGSLPDEEYLQALAYLLKLNRMPAGEQPLPADSAGLKAIRFDTTSSRGTPP